MYTFLFVLGSFLTAALASSSQPIPKSNKQKFCESDFVGTFTVWGKGENYTHVFYNGLTHEIFKTDGSIKTGSLITVFTNRLKEHSGICWFESGKKYLINGASANGSLFISTSDAISVDEWTTIPDDTKKPLRDGTYLPCQKKE
ncbi:hypothetical protein QR680_010026 [Steinernema hermaphroditum]|uniref:C-type lectin domain-containing protein n=1 Tax=Steinernema hermaphroditum TaxID=289476 RepID=A0AA39IMG7_9BILA|nr:hypothetical protein QR680_010026 [Steinernema hermaphroditum]